MCLPVRSMYQDVVNKAQDMLKAIMDDMHGATETTGSIHHAKRHDLKLVQPITSGKSSILLGLVTQGYMPKLLAKSILDSKAKM